MGRSRIHGGLETRHTRSRGHAARDGLVRESNAKLFSAADAACIERFEEFIALDYDDSEIVAYAYYPSQESWTMDNRRVTCAVTEFEPTTGSLEGANR